MGGKFNESQIQRGVSGKKIRGTFTKEIIEAVEMFLGSSKETACFESNEKAFSKKAVGVIKRHYDGKIEATESCGKVYIRKCKNES